MQLPDRSQFNKAIDEARRNHPDIARAAADKVLAAAARDVVNAVMERVRVEQELNADEAKPHYNTPSFDTIASPETRRVFEEAYENTRQLFDRIDLSIPDADSFTAAGVDFNHLANKYEEMEDMGHEPMVVISPSLPLVNNMEHSKLKYYGELSWKALYRELMLDATIHNNPLKFGGIDEHSETSGLSIDRDAVFESYNLHLQEIGQIERTVFTRSEKADVLWTVAIVPGTNMPDGVGVVYEGKQDGDHIFISQYLTAQAVRIQEGQQPMDVHSSTWLWGQRRDHNGRPHAAVGKWADDLGKVVINTLLIPEWAIELGIRSPAW